jgi:signal transduction histidine kinase
LHPWIGWLVASFAAATIIDYSAQWPYVMTPLYAVPILVAADYGTPRVVGLVAAAATATNILSAILQGTPAEIWTLYTSGLVLTAYLAVRLAHQRQETARRAEEAEHARNDLQQFMGMVAHDLASPLTGLILHANLLHDRFAQLSTEQQEHGIAAIHVAAQRMKRLNTDLLDASRLATGHFRVEPSPTDLAEVVRNVVALSQTAAPNHPIVLVAPEHLEGQFDRQRAAQMLVNLISNAAKYSPEHTTVRVTAERQGENAVVRDSDHGRGLTPEELASLFRPFARLDRDRHVEGTGLGLSITQAIARAHGGHILVESEPGRGSTFSVVLPLAPPEQPGEAASEATARGIVMREASKPAGH